MLAPMDSPPDPLSASVPGRIEGVTRSASSAWIALARAGDRAALAELLALHHERLRRIVRARLGAHLRTFVDSCDIVQETYRVVLSGIEHVDPARDGEFLAWLAQAATNRIRDAHDRMHAARRDVGREVRLDPGASAGSPILGALAGSADSPSQEAMLGEVRDHLDAALAELPIDQREVILLRDYCGCEWESIAKELHSVSIPAARQLHQRAWIRLRQIVAPRLGG